MKKTKNKQANTTVERRAYRIPEFGEAFRLSVSTVYKLIATGQLATVVIGGRRLIPVEAADALMRGEAAADTDRRLRPYNGKPAATN